MARDALLNTLSTINDGTAVWATGTLGDGLTASSGTVYYSQTQAITPYTQTGTSQLLFMRFSLGTMTTTGVPTTNAANGFQFAVQASKDGSVWTTVSASPKDLFAFKNHNTMLPTMATNASVAFAPHASVTQTSGALTVGSANIPGAPLVSIGDVVYFNATGSGFNANTPYYVISAIPTGAGTAPRATIQVSLTYGGAPVLATAVTAVAVIEYTSAMPLQVNDRLAIGNAVVSATGTDGPGGTAVTLITNDVVLITSVFNTGTSMAFTFRRVVGGTMTNNYVHTNATALGTTAFYMHSDTGGEYFLPILTQCGFQSNSAQVEDNYKFVRGIAACNINTVVPTGKLTCDIVTSRDGAYS